ncbi:MAG: DUF1698 domain-containing protein, partial [Actinobacteria bacterium]|nr:DUF1698 domain-containing protein [Actinomycetota bacterium]
SRIVALDHYVWCIDFGARTEYWNSCKEQGIIPDLDRDEVDFWHPDAPGKRGFDFAREALDSSVEDVVADFMTIDLDSLGSFDVVFYLGVLYHVREPFLALRRLRQATREVAVVETVAVAVEHHTDQPLLAFYAGDDLSADYGNWFAPSEKALHNMLRAAGFSRVETKAGPVGLVRKIVARAAPQVDKRIDWRVDRKLEERVLPELPRQAESLTTISEMSEKMLFTMSELRRWMVDDLEAANETTVLLGETLTRMQAQLDRLEAELQEVNRRLSPGA